eukprot:CAMPEP_0167799180 /NCGR_PEP_ID=MMETSP0111_2-20121227/16824_1 /TAXON_ID=91324 /ORGANISM="Lotharella globosa, Strain CCCM811" /LENGTH=105 /DNA_ID=CAMNT_0007693883 /DNA_START=23 /DNA_END=340 /DNA_ORIENTATION=+
MAYASHAMGRIDTARPDLRKAVAKNTTITGQCRVNCNPKAFLDQKLVKIFAFQGQENRHEQRLRLQQELRVLLRRHYDKHPVQQSDAYKSLLTPRPKTLKPRLKP